MEDFTTSNSSEKNKKKKRKVIPVLYLKKGEKIEKKT